MLHVCMLHACMQLRLIVEHALVREFKAVDAPDAPIGAPLATLPTVPW